MFCIVACFIALIIAAAGFPVAGICFLVGAAFVDIVGDKDSPL